MARMNRQALGKWGEELAADYLRQHGYTILERNARTRFGEIDLVASQSGTQGSMTVFVEVKTRRSDVFGWPEQAISSRKKAHLLEASQRYLQAHPEVSGDWRVDVIAIRLLERGEKPEIVHFENALAA